MRRGLSNGGQCGKNAVPDVGFQSQRHICILHTGRKRLIDGEQILLLIVRRRVCRKIIAHNEGGVWDDHRRHAEIIVLRGELLHRGQRPVKHSRIGGLRDLNQIIVLTKVNAVGLLLPKQLVDPQLGGNPVVARKELICKGRLQLRHKASVQN